MSLRQNLLNGVKSVSDDIPLRLVFSDGESFDFAPEPRVTLILRSRRLARLFLTGRIDRLGDAYVSGELAVEGEIEDVLSVGMQLAERFGRSARLQMLLKPLSYLRFRHSVDDDAAAVRHHYDVPTEFYRPWLDSGLTYSCAYFPTGTEDIDAAQQAKIGHICRKLRLQPGDRLIDIGCGWGSLLIHAAEQHGVTGVGLTNSRAQHEGALRRVRDHGLEDRIEVRCQDYREVPKEEQYDKVVSVGMYEHVGVRNWPVYFSTVERLLKPGGTLLNHGIVTTDPEGRPQGPPGGEFINRHVFPGGELSNLSSTVQALARSGMEVYDVEDLRPHYARTLLLWLRRLEAASAAVIAAGGVERYRVWRVYLAGMAHAFDRGWLSIAQVLAVKPVDGRPGGRPWSRAHQYGSPADAPLAKPLDWSPGRQGTMTAVRGSDGPERR